MIQLSKTVFTFLAVLCFSVVPTAAQNLVISVEQVQEMMTGEKKAALIDVRSPAEYKEGHIPGAINIPAEKIIPDKARLPKDKSTPIIFYCRGTG